MKTNKDREAYIANLITNDLPLTTEQNEILREMYINKYQCDNKVAPDHIIGFFVDYGTMNEWKHLKQKCIHIKYYDNNGVIQTKSLSKKRLAGAKTSKKQLLKQAFRLAINDDILAFSKFYNAIPGTHQVDHTEPFIQLFDQFMKIKKYSKKRINNLKFYQDKILNDDEIVQDWIKYHNENAKLQILTQKENSIKRDKIVSENDVNVLPLVKVKKIKCLNCNNSMHPSYTQCNSCYLEANR